MDMQKGMAALPTDSLVSLAESDRGKITQLKNQIDLADGQAIIQFGVGVQNKIADFADRVLGEVRAKDAGSVGNMLTDLLLQVKAVDLDRLREGKGFFESIPLIGGLFDKARRFIAQQETIIAQIEEITQKLDRSWRQLMKDITMLDGLFDRNVEYFRELETYILAGEEKLGEARTQALPEMEAKVKASSDPIAAQRLRDFVQVLNRFEKRIHDLKLNKTIALQTLPQIRLIQGSNQELTEKIQTSILNTIPLWKNQIVIAISLLRQKKALELQKKVSETTNELLRKNAEMLKTGTTEIAKEAERGIVDIETLKKVNDDLIATIEEVIRIHQDGRAKRQQAEQELLQIETNLKQKLLQTKEG
jgi:uncharacterized protein YaaN involved in tellurite resistance